MTPRGNRWRTGSKVLVLLAVVIGGGLILRVTMFRPAVVPVTVHKVTRGRVEDTVVNSRAGTVQSRLRAAMSPGIPGLVTEIVVRKGAKVRKGDVLLRLDHSEHEAQVQLASRSLEAAEAVTGQARLEAEWAARQWHRSQTLASNQVVSETALDQDRTRAFTTAAAVRVADARKREAEAALEVAQATLAKTTLRAPFDGVLLDVKTEVGEWISPAPPGVPIPPVLDLIDPGSLYVSAPIDEADMARIRQGLPARITLDAFRNRAFTGIVSYISSFVETREDQNRTLRVEAEIKETELPVNLLPGLSADVEVILDARDDVVRVPTYALVAGSRVLMVEGGRLVERHVTTGLHNWSFTEIVSGLTAGEQVVVSLDRPEVKAGARAVASEEVDR